MHYLLLFGGILAEMVGAAALKLTNGFRYKKYTIICLAAYGMAYYLVACAMRVLPLSVAYATWCGMGTLLTMMMGIALFKEKFKLSGYIGMMLLLGGIVVLNIL